MATKGNEKKEAIVKAAYELFMENGFDGTSIRMLTSQVGCKVGLFYYYFKNKDDVFEQAMGMFFDYYKKGLMQIVDDGRRDTSSALMNFFEYIETETLKFREKYEGKMHWTVRSAIREHTLVIIEPYIRQMLEIIQEQGGRFNVDIDTAAAFLTFGVGSVILHESTEEYQAKRAGLMHGVHILLGMEPGKSNEGRV